MKALLAMDEEGKEEGGCRVGGAWGKKPAVDRNEKRGTNLQLQFR